MRTQFQHNASSFLALVAFGGVGLVLFIAFKAGCAGDPKIWTLGSPARALEIEATAVLPFVTSLVCATIAVGLSGIAASMNRRIAYAVVLVPIAGAFC